MSKRPKNTAVSNASVGDLITFKNLADVIFTGRVCSVNEEGYQVDQLHSIPPIPFSQVLRINKPIEDRNRILKDISERLYHGAGVDVIIIALGFGKFGHRDLVRGINGEKVILEKLGEVDPLEYGVREMLYPLSSVTPDLYDKYLNVTAYPDTSSIEGDDILESFKYSVSSDIASINWLRDYRIDYNGLIPQHLAIELTREECPFELS